MVKKEALFNEFDPVSTHDWEQKILQDLKGKPLEKLTWRTPEGFDVKPFYRQEDLEGLEYLKNVPGRKTSDEAVAGNAWEIRQDIEVTNWKEANVKALEALSKGATSLGFIIPDEQVVDRSAMDTLLNDIYFECINLNFVTTIQSAEVIHLVAEIAQERGLDLTKINGSVDADPLGYLSRYGDYPGGTGKAFEKQAALVSEYSVKMPGMRITGINGKHFSSAGSSLVEELAFSLAMVSEYLDKLSGRAVSVDHIARSLQLNLSAGPAYFMEIAKFRAARLLFAHLVKAWKPTDESVLKCYIHATTSEWNQTVYDPYVNMLRATTESMAVAMGGADSLSVTPFDKAFRRTTAFSERIARNIQVILKEEAALDKVSDPSAGAYYIENLTDSIAGNAWKLFLEVEEKGGYLKALEDGFIQEKIKSSANRRDMNLATRKDILLGTNQYPNATETLPGDFDPAVAFPPNEKKTGHIVEPLQCYRGAQPFEQLRMQTEKRTAIPVVFLLTYGNPVMRKARATFAGSFFACAGYTIINNPGFETIEEGLEAALAKQADIVVLCSADDEYPVSAPAAVSYLQGKAILAIAGYPTENIDELNEKGVKHFIHLKSNLLEELKMFHQLLGIE